MSMLYHFTDHPTEGVLTKLEVLARIAEVFARDGIDLSGPRTLGIMQRMVRDGHIAPLRRHEANDSEPARP